MSATHNYLNKKSFRTIMTLPISQCLTDREGEKEGESAPLTVCLWFSTIVEGRLSVSLPPSIPLLSSWDGSNFEFNEREENSTLHRTHMGPQKVPNQFLFNNGKQNSIDVHSADEM